LLDKMLKSFKSKFTSSSKKDAPKMGREEMPSSSGSSSKTVPSSMGKVATSTRPASAAREKPPIPVLNDQSFANCYSDPLPSFRDVPPSEKQNLFVAKLHLAAFSFDFTDPTKQVREKEMKRQTLLELVDYANTGTGKFTELVSEDIVFMIASNLFRSLPPARSHEVSNFDAEEEEPSLDPSWPHLQVCRVAMLIPHVA
jgi:serine/threonine-protein phosphatase 2A regulatory subunit B'